MGGSNKNKRWAESSLRNICVLGAIESVLFLLLFVSFRYFFCSFGNKKQVKKKKKIAFQTSELFFKRKITKPIFGFIPHIFVSMNYVSDMDFLRISGDIVFL